MLINQINRAKIFLRGNLFATADFTNSGGTEVTLLKGTVMGRITASGKLKTLESDATDGSEEPIGVLADDYVIDAGATAKLTYCYAGRVAEEELILTKSGDTLNTVVTGKGIIRDLITRNTHISLELGTDLTKYDNA